MESLLEYPAEVRLEVYEAAIRYALSGTLSELKPLSRMAFSFIKRQIDYDNEKYNEICKRNKKNVTKRYSKEESEVGVGNDRIRNLPNLRPYTVVTDNDNDNDIDKDKDKERLSNESTKKADELAAACAATLAKHKSDFYNTLVPFVELYGKETVRDFFDYWTEPNKSNTKMRFELEKTWDVGRRMRTWNNRKSRYEKDFGKNGGSVGMILTDNSEDKFKNAKGW